MFYPGLGVGSNKTGAGVTDTLVIDHALYGFCHKSSANKHLLPMENSKA